jgi:hypothetical protein
VGAHQLGKPFSVHGQSSSGGDTGDPSALENEGASQFQLRLQDARGADLSFAAEGVAAHDLRQLGGTVGWGLNEGAHLEKSNAKTSLGQLPNGLAPREAASHNDDIGRETKFRLQHLDSISGFDMMLP